VVKENQNITLVIDSHCVGYIAKYTTGALSYLSDEDLDTGIIFGFMLQIYRLARKFDTIDFVFCWDSRVSKRKGMFKEYQVKRKTQSLSGQEIKENISFYKQLTELRANILPSLGFVNCFQQSGYESDDLIASVVTNNKRNFIVVTNDKDMYQLLSCCRIYDPRQKTILTSNTLMEEWSVTPQEWVMVKAIAGCGSDEIPGVVGVAEKTAVKYIRGELKKGVVFDRIQSSKEIIDRNLGLVRIPIQGTDRIELSEPSEYLDYDFFYEMCDKYGFVSFFKELDSWRKVLRLESYGAQDKRVRST
jgi:5'-3' exonuclease